MYTVWMNGQKIGETRFDVRPAPRKLGGVFQPTTYGLTVLPGITAMPGALLDFGAMCRANGIDTDDDRPEAGEAALEAFAESPEGLRVQAAAAQIAQLELRDPNGRTLTWESILISDLSDLPGIVAKHAGGKRTTVAMRGADPVRYLISATLAPHGAESLHEDSAASEPTPVC